MPGRGDVKPPGPVLPKSTGRRQQRSYKDCYAVKMAQRALSAARGARRQLLPRLRQLSAFRDAYLVRSQCSLSDGISGFAPLDGLILARTRSRSTAAARAPPPRVERRRSAPPPQNRRSRTARRRRDRSTTFPRAPTAAGDAPSTPQRHGSPTPRKRRPTSRSASRSASSPSR